jgi:hypothetical protein
MARLAYSDGVSIPTIVRVLKMGRSTVYRVLEIEQEPEEPVVWTRALVLEAGQVYFQRYGQTPTSVAWNRTLARKDPEAWSRWCVGWAPVATPRRWRHWPTPRLVDFYWGGWADFRRAVEESASSYQPTPLPAYRQRAAAVTRALGHAPRTPAGHVVDEIFVEAMIELEYEWRWGRRTARRRLGGDWSGD